MNGLQDLMSGFEALEALIIRVTGLIGVLLICLLVTKSHVKSLRKSQNRKRKGNQISKQSK
jgi:hypothetical protein